MLQEQYQNAINRTEDFFQQAEHNARCWDAFFVRQEPLPADAMDPLILESWIRCRDRGLDPYHVHREIITPEELNHRQTGNQHLIQATKPVFDAFVSQMKTWVATLDLYDKDLTFIHTFGDTPPERARRYAVPGFRCREETAGVTAMSLARAQGRPIQIVGAEHFDASLHDKICTSVPLFNAKGALIGIINVVEYLNAEASRTVGMLYAIGQGITYSMKLLEQQKELETVNNFNQAILGAIGDAILVVDAQGVISMMNQTARHLLGVEKDSDALGHRIEALYGESNSFSMVLKSGKPLSSKEIVVRKDGVSIYFFGSIHAVSGGDTKIGGVIGTFNDMPATQRVMKNFGGWSAAMTFQDVVGTSPAMQSVIQLARQTASLPSNILIQGESGTGKEVFANAIHNASKFSDGPFVAINCAAIPNSLMESELFGYEGGAYTGAKKNGQPGKFELAQNGTVFLDEINSMPLGMQAKLLRVLQEKTVSRLGGNNKIVLKVKVIAATSANLADSVQAGLFRADLFYRLNVITIHLPPLRERISDLESLCAHFLVPSEPSGPKPSISADAMEMLRGYSWPGNVRELENLLERAWIHAGLAGEDTINGAVLSAFPEFFTAAQLPPNPQVQPDHSAAEHRPFAGGGGNIRAVQKQEVLTALEQNHWNVSKAAQALGIARNTLYNRMKKYGIEW